MLSQTINLLNTVADLWLAWLAVTFVNTAILLAVVGAIWFLLRRRLAPEIGYWLFLLVPLKLLVPMQLTLPVALPDWTASESPTPIEATKTTASAAVVAPASAAPRVTVQQPLIELPEPSPHAGETATDSFKQMLSPPVAPVVAPIPSDAAVIPEAASPIARPSLPALAMLLWAAGVLLMVGCWMVRHWRFGRQLQSADPIDPRRYPVDLAELCRRAGISSPIRFVASERIAAPAVTGILRPTLVLPVGLPAALAPEKIEWAILHELAHIRRRDLAVILVQRLAAILHFFNPAVWIANRLAHGLREYACDDLASDWAGRTPEASGEAFVEVLRYAKRQSTPALGLGVLGLDARSSRTGRVQRMLDRGEGTINRPGRWSVLALCLIALVALPNLRAADEETSANDEAAVSTKPKNTSDQTPRSTDGGDDTNSAAKNTFELLVLGPDGKPVPNIEVEFRRPSESMKDDVFVGELVKQKKYEVLIETNAEGRIVVRKTNLPKNIRFSIDEPGYGPFYCGDINSAFPGPTTPDHVTVHLDRAWSVGSIIVDSEGHPIAGVEVRPSVQFKRLPGVHDRLGVGTDITTDKKGRWRYDSAPKSKDYVWVEINHPQYQPRAIPLKRAKYGIKPGQEPQARVTLKPGLTVRGRVTNQAGEPIEGALLRIRFVNDERTDKTNAEGYYKVIGCEPKVTQIVVSAEGMAIDAKKIHVEPDMAAVNFQMKLGGTVRVRVLDHEGNPVSKARIFFQDWRGDDAYFAFDRVDQYTNEQGVWEWHEAPHDEFTADICGTGMDLSYVPLKAREEEYVFKLPPALVVSGSVTDAETNELIERYHVVPGLRSRLGDMQFITREKLKVTDGTYQVRFDRQHPGFVVRVEAPGYVPGTSRELEYDEGKVTIDFALKKGTNVAAQVLTPEGKPAAGAEIALGLAGSQINIENGRIDDSSTYHAERTSAGKQGWFQFPPQASSYHLVIMHRTGYAHVTGRPGEPLEPITLTAWARIEGIYFVGNQKQSGIPITVLPSLGNDLHSYGRNVPHIFAGYEDTTGPGGTFIFDRVVPGDVRVGRQIVRMVNEGATEVASSKRVPLKLEAGRTYKLKIGAKGRPIKGQLVPPSDYKEDIIWSFAEVELRPAGPPRPDYPVDLGVDPKKKQEWFKKWSETPEGEDWVKAYREYRSRLETLPRWSASVDHHGRFQINSVTPGEYWLNASFGPGRDETLRIFRHRVTVPPNTNKNRHQPIDLGKLHLKQ